MRKVLKRILFCSLPAIIVWGSFLLADREKLNHGLIRFHVVANSDSETDQTIKLTIRDVVLDSIQSDLGKIADIAEAKEYLQQNIPKIQKLVDHTLNELGFQEGASISLCREQFDIRHYDTFSLPAGVYDSLRIVIGDGRGKNWWCVSFPTLCIPATTVGFTDTAVSAGFSKPLVQALTGNEEYEIHFFFLNQLGKLENILFQE